MFEPMTTTQKVLATMIDSACDKNVFQLWEEGGEKLPFKVARWTWKPGASAFLVERVEIGKWPYGKAWGRFIRSGVPQATQELSGAGSYQWKVVGGSQPVSRGIAAIRYGPYGQNFFGAVKRNICRL